MKKNINKNNVSKTVLLLPYLFLTILFVLLPLIFILQKSFTSTIDSVTNESLGVENNWNFINSSIIEKISLSLGIAIATTVLCLIIGYLFAYFLSLSKNIYMKIIAISLITSPIWISMLIKLVGLKTFFDFLNGSPNSTYGNFYTIIALTYINLPIFILTIYTYINSIPNNLMQASKDLGKSSFQTFFFVVVPYTKNAIISGILLVFLPSFTNAGVTQFINNSNDGSMIGNDLLNQGLEGSSNQIALARVSSLSFFMCLLILLFWSMFVLIPKAIKTHKNSRSNKNVSHLFKQK